MADRSDGSQSQKSDRCRALDALLNQARNISVFRKTK
jgi:hypothetical protein